MPPQAGSLAMARRLCRRVASSLVDVAMLVAAPPVSMLLFSTPGGPPRAGLVSACPQDGAEPPVQRLMSAGLPAGDAATSPAAAIASAAASAIAVANATIATVYGTTIEAGGCASSQACRMDAGGVAGGPSDGARSLASEDDFMDMLALGQRVARVFLMHCAAHLVLGQLWRVALGAARYGALTREQRMGLSERVLSSINAARCVSASLRQVFVSHSVYSSVSARVVLYTPEAYTLFSYYLGYLLYDICIMFRERNKMISMWIHHALALNGVALLLFLKQQSYIPTMFGLTESTALVQNMIWYSKKLGTRRALVNVLFVLRAIVFLTMRLWVAPYAIHQVMKDSSYSWSTFKEQWFSKGPCSPHPLASTFTVINVLTLGVLNFGWSAAVCHRAVISMRSLRWQLLPKPHLG